MSSDIYNFTQYNTQISKLLDDLILHDAYSYYHSLSVAKYCLMFADFLNYDKNHKTSFILSALLHDIGKIGIKKSILNTKGELSQEDPKWSYKFGNDLVPP